MCVSKTPNAVREQVMIPTHQIVNDKTLCFLSQYNKSKLENLISKLQAIGNVMVCGSPLFLTTHIQSFIVHWLWLIEESYSFAFLGTP